jgi:hypothetical protein
MVNFRNRPEARGKLVERPEGYKIGNPDPYTVGEVPV